MKEFLKQTEVEELSNGVRTDFSKRENGEELAERFTKTGILGMHEPEEYENIDLCHLFLTKLKTCIAVSQWIRW